MKNRIIEVTRLEEREQGGIDTEEDKINPLPHAVLMTIWWKQGPLGI